MQIGNILVTGILGCLLLGLGSQASEEIGDADVILSARAAMDEGRYEEAFATLWPLAQSGNAEAQTGIGVCLAYGWGVSADPRAARRWFEKAADQGDTRAAFNLARMYAEGLGVARDCEEAVRRYVALAESGDVMAQVNLGGMYADGDACIEPDPGEALKWYRAAAEQGDPLGQHNLGVMYALGEGVTQSFTEALKWYQRAAAQGYAVSQTTLGSMYQFGEGVRQDPSAAARYYELAAAQGYAEAQYRLGYLYESGEGVPRDHERALYWYRRAEQEGHEDAGTRLAALEAAGDSPGDSRDLDRLMAMPDLELARVYERSDNLLGYIGLAEFGMEVHAGGRTITRENAARVREELQARLAMCREAIEQRGSADIAGHYRVTATPACAESRSGWAGFLCESEVREVVISQQGCDAVITYEYVLDGERGSIETPIAIVGTALTFQDFMNTDFIFVGDVENGTIRIRPDTDAVLAAWPSWAHPPERRQLEACEVTLVAKR